MTVAIKKTPFGKLPDGSAVDAYTLQNKNGMMVKIISYGTIITEIHVPDRQGKMADVALGFDQLAAYLKGHPYFGCTVGRFANRIAGGRFTLDGKEYRLAVNNGPNSLHGGLKGFDKMHWKAATLGRPDSASVVFSYLSPDGEEGYPGNLDVTVGFTLTGNDELRIDYTATTDKATPINLTNHSYFNLAGEGVGDIRGHEMRVFSDAYVPTNGDLIPTGEIKPVAGTVMDFTKSTVIGSRFPQMSGGPVGYDGCYVLRDGGGKPGDAAHVKDPASGRVMDVWTTEPGIQLYTGNFLDGTLKGKKGAAYQRHSGFCLEAQHYPDSVNQPSFPAAILKPGKSYKQTTIYAFKTE
jgi:aldose 1-epimerase